MRCTFRVRRISRGANLTMARRKTQFVEGEFYHIYNRGCNKEQIFREERNYVFLLTNLKEKAKKHQISVIAYCLMPNHYHFLLRQDAETSVGVLIQDVFNSYTKAFNEMFQRTGTLFEGPFKSIHVDKEEYLLHLCRYIHRNPLDAKLVNDIESWQFSNYHEWVGKRNGNLFDQKFLGDHFQRPQQYAEFVLQYEAPKKLQKEMSKLTWD